MTVDVVVIDCHVSTRPWCAALVAVLRKQGLVVDHYTKDYERGLARIKAQGAWFGLIFGSRELQAQQVQVIEAFERGVQFSWTPVGVDLLARVGGNDPFCRSG